MEGSEKMKCFTCGGDMKKKDDLSFEAYRSGMLLVVNGLKGYVCDSCGEVSYTRESVKKIEAALERIENFSPGYTRKLSSSNGEITLRLPKEIYKSLNLTGGEEVAVTRLDKNKILVSVNQ
jgi:YgiT-type zinc finger domain-containing protein